MNQGNTGLNYKLPSQSVSPTLAQWQALNITLLILSKQAFELDRRILALKTRAEALIAKGAQEQESLAQNDAEIRKTEKKAKAIEKKLLRPDPAAKASPPALSAKMTALATYIPFPYEEEKQRVLGWFAQ